MTADHEFALEWIRKAEHDLESALILNSYAVETRYRGEYCEPEHADAEEALRIASEMFGLAKKKLGVQTG